MNPPKIIITYHLIFFLFILRVANLLTLCLSFLSSRTPWWIRATCRRACCQGTWRPRCPSTWITRRCRRAQTWTASYPWTSSARTPGNTWAGPSPAVAEAAAAWFRRRHARSRTSTTTGPPRASSRSVRTCSAACWTATRCERAREITTLLRVHQRAGKKSEAGSWRLVQVLGTEIAN